MGNIDTKDNVTPPPKGVTIFFSVYETCQKLSAHQRHRLLDSILEYSFGGISPDFGDDLALELSWINIRPNLDSSIRRSVNGAKGGRPRKEKARKSVVKSVVKSDTPYPIPSPSTNPVPTPTPSPSPISIEEGDYYSSDSMMEFAHEDFDF